MISSIKLARRDPETFQALGENVLIEREPEALETKSGIILIDEDYAKPKPVVFGKLVSAGGDVIDTYGKDIIGKRVAVHGRGAILSQFGWNGHRYEVRTGYDLQGVFS